MPATDLFSKDPCQLVTRAEVEAFIGPLIHDPYRGGDDHITADSTGDVCLYRAVDGRSVEVSVVWLDGKTKIKEYTDGLLSKLNVNLADKGKADTLSDVWDEAAVQESSLYALKADTLIQIDYEAAMMPLGNAAKLAEDAIGRLGHPLAYSGGRATIGAPGPLVAARDPCTVLTKSEVEAVLGPLKADPVSDGNSCQYQTATRNASLWVSWTGGFRSLAGGRGAQANASALLGKQFMNPEDMKKALAGRAKYYQKAGADNLDLDTTVAGPWTDSRRTQDMEVVKKDVDMKMSLTQVTVAQATALLTTAMNKI
jgi:hypothetical protein